METNRCTPEPFEPIRQLAREYKVPYRWALDTARTADLATIRPRKRNQFATRSDFEDWLERKRTERRDAALANRRGRRA
jgi:hypothetical protein